MVPISEKLKGKGRTERHVIDASSTSARKAREVYWMKDLRTMGLMTEYVMDLKQLKGILMFVLNLGQKNLEKILVVENRKNNTNGLCCGSKNMLETNIMKTPNFTRISICTTKRFSLKSVHQLLNSY